MLARSHSILASKWLPRTSSVRRKLDANSSSLTAPSSRANSTQGLLSIYSLSKSRIGSFYSHKNLYKPSSLRTRRFERCYTSKPADDKSDEKIAPVTAEEETLSPEEQLLLEQEAQAVAEMWLQMKEGKWNGEFNFPPKSTSSESSAPSTDEHASSPSIGATDPALGDLNLLEKGDTSQSTPALPSSTTTASDQTIPDLSTSTPDPQVSLPPQTPSPSISAEKNEEIVKPADSSPPPAEAPAELGRIIPKRITLEEAEKLGIDTSSVLAKKKEPLYESEARRKERAIEEGVERVKDKTGPKQFNFERFTNNKDFVAKFEEDKWLWICAGLLLLAPVMQFVMDPEHEIVERRKGWRFQELWERTEYTYMADKRTESIIFEMCGMAAIGALPPFNPLTSPMQLIRGSVQPIYPQDRQSLGPPVFWKLRIDFPAPAETVWEKNDFTEATVVPASPTYLGTQFMWILSRTWENGEPLIRVLAGRQVGGTIKANPLHSLLPWRSPVFRPHRLRSNFYRPIEADLMFKSLYQDDTYWYDMIKAYKWEHALAAVESNMLDYKLENFEYEMLDAHGFGDYIYNPSSVQWPADFVVIDPLGVANNDDVDDDLGADAPAPAPTPTRAARRRRIRQLIKDEKEDSGDWDLDFDYEYEDINDQFEKLGPQHWEENGARLDDEYDEYDDYYEEYDEDEFLEDELDRAPVRR